MGVSASLEGAGGGDEAAEARRASASLPGEGRGGLSHLSNQLIFLPKSWAGLRVRGQRLLLSRRLAAVVEKAGGAYSEG